MPEVEKLQFEITMEETGAIAGNKKVVNATKELSKEAEKSTKKMESFSARLKKSWVGITAIVVAAIATVKKAFDFTKAFAQYQQGMNALARNTGKNADTIVKKLKEVSDGTVSNKDIMLAANRLVALNVTKNTDEMAKLFEIARLKAKAMGISTTEAIDSIATGIGRQSPLILDNLGIITKGWAEEAKAAGKAMDTQFVLNKILKQGAEELKRAGSATVTPAERFERMSASLKNLSLIIGKLLTPVLMPLIGIFTKITTFVGGALTRIGKFVTKLTMTREEIAEINKEMAKPALLRIREKEVQIIEDGIEATLEKIKTTRNSIKAIEDEVAAIEQGNLTIRDASKETRIYLKDVSDISKGMKTGTTILNRYHAEIGMASEKIADKTERLKFLKIEIEKSIETTARDADAKKDAADAEAESIEEREANIADYYTFINDQRQLDLLREQEAYTAALEGLGLMLEERQITRQEFQAMREELEAVHNERLLEITDDRVQKEKAMSKSVRDAWNQAVMNVVTDYSRGITDMIFEQKKWKKNFGDFVKDFIKGVLKMITQLLIMKGIMAALGGIGIFFRQGGYVPEFAGGGKIHGASHSSGGVDLKAEGGEFITRKESVTPNTLPVLMAINRSMGNLGALATSMQGGRMRMQAGGQVPRNISTDNSRIVNVEKAEITTDDPEEMFDKFVEIGEDMGVDLVRRG